MVQSKIIPDLLALVGDAADGYPGVAGIGARTAAQLLEPIRFDRKISALGPIGVKSQHLTFISSIWVCDLRRAPEKPLPFVNAEGDTAA